MRFAVLFMFIVYSTWCLSEMELSNKLHQLKKNREYRAFAWRFKLNLNRGKGIKMMASLCGKGDPEFENECLATIFNNDYFWA